MRHNRAFVEPVYLTINDKPRYLPYTEARRTVTEDILLMNEFISKAMSLAGIHLFSLIEDNIRWEIPSNLTGFFCYIRYPPLTKTGRIPKFDEELHWTCGDSFGEIYYQNGKMGKARIVQWQQNDIYVCHLKMVGELLSLWKIERGNIERGNNGVKITLWKL